MRRLVLVLALLLGSAVPVLADEACPPYNRKEWPHWAKQDPSGLTTRDYVLIRDGKNVEVEDGIVLGGEWYDPYTGDTVDDPKALDIDHVVPLKWAHDHGGCYWDRARKKAYANNLGYFWALRAVNRRENQTEKGARGPADYQPPFQMTLCQYGQAFATVVVMEGLTIEDRDREAIRAMVATCKGGS